MAKLVSKTYGDALFGVAQEADRLDDFYGEAQAILVIIRENEELSKLMSHPQIGKDEKLQMLEEIFKGKILDEILGLMRMVVEKNHFSEINGIFEYFIDAVKEHKQIGTAYVTSALDLSDAQKAAIEKKLLETTDYVEFEMHYKTDAALIGGMVVRIGDRVVDGSIRTKLDRLSQELSKIQLKVGECAP